MGILFGSVPASGTAAAGPTVAMADGGHRWPA
uniref:Uncharacterized protein n=1 Tax=Arundo donax TaxID=35708 RepID=A0A0A9H3U6_ARUDO